MLISRRRNTCAAQQSYTSPPGPPAIRSIIAGIINLMSSLSLADAVLSLLSPPSPSLCPCRCAYVTSSSRSFPCRRPLRMPMNADPCCKIVCLNVSRILITSAGAKRVAKQRVIVHAIPSPLFPLYRHRSSRPSCQLVQFTQRRACQSTVSDCNITNVIFIPFH